MFGLFKNFKNEMNKGKTVACLKGYLTKSAVMLEAGLEIHSIIDIYSNTIVDMAEKLFDANRKTKISPYTMSLTCLWKAIEIEYEFHKIESLGGVVVNALLMIGEHIENDTNLQSSFSEIDRIIYLDITKRMDENREKLMGNFMSSSNEDSSQVEIDKTNDEEITISTVKAIILIVTKIAYCEEDVSNDIKVKSLIMNLMIHLINKLDLTAAEKQDASEYIYTQYYVYFDASIPITTYTKELKFNSTSYRKEIIAGFFSILVQNDLPRTTKREELLKQVLNEIYPSKKFEDVLQILGNYFMKNKNDFVINN